MLLNGVNLGPYSPLRLLGRGGMGEVYLARDTRVARRQVAIKVMRIETGAASERGRTQEAIRLFKREAEAIAQLDHPNILPLYDYGEEKLDDITLIYYLVMPYRKEGTLEDWLQQRDSSPLLTPAEVLPLVKQAADALQHAHDQDIIHQDIKPRNFLIRLRQDQPGCPDLLLADFGIAKLTNATASTGQVSRGTSTYMAPEQWNGHPVSATDQYALAIMVYKLLVGRPPFEGNDLQLMYQHCQKPPPDPRTFNPQLSTAMSAVLQRALSKSPEERFPSVTAFAQALQEAAQSVADFSATLAISQDEAETGTTRQVTLPGGNPRSIVVPAGASDGTVLRLAGQGMPSHEGGVNGVLVVTIAILTEERPLQVLQEDTFVSGGLNKIATPGIAAQSVGISAKGAHVPQPLNHSPQAAGPTQQKPRFSRYASVASTLGRALPRSVQPPGRSVRRTPRKSNRVLNILLLAVLFLLIVFGFLFYMLPTATVIVALKGQSYAQPVQLESTPNPQATNLDNVPSQRLQKDFTASGQGTATGTTRVANGFAEGYIAITNNGDDGVIVPSDTIFTTTSGIQFETDAEDFITDHTTSYYIPITAKQAGTSGNVGPDQITVIPQTSITSMVQSNGLSSSAIKLTVTNDQATTGGGSTNQSAVSASDLHNLTLTLHKQLQQQIQLWLSELSSGDLSGTPGPDITDSPTPLPAEQLKDAPAAGQSEPTGTFSGTLSVPISLLVVREQDLQQTARKQLNARAMTLPHPSIFPDDQPVTLSQVKTTTSQDGTALTINAQASGLIIPLISPSTLSSALAGKSLAQVENDPANVGLTEAGTRVTASVSPPFLTILPLRADRIQIIFHAITS